MKNKTEFNAELSTLMEKYNIGLSVMVTEFKEGNNTVMSTSVFDTVKNKSRRNKLLKEVSDLFQKTGLDYSKIKNINDVLESAKLELEMLTLIRDIKEVAISENVKKKLKSIRSNKKI